MWLIIIAAALPAICRSQPAKKHDTLTPKKKILFEDDYSHNIVGQFPSGWHVSTRTELHDPSNKKYCRVIKKNSDFIFSVPVLDYKGLCIEPDTIAGEWLPNSFELEYDFVLENKNTAVNISLCPNPVEKNCGCLFFTTRCDDPGSLTLGVNGWGGSTQNQTCGFPEHMDYNSFHHFRLNFDNGTIKCYIDKYRMRYMQDVKFYPRLFILCLAGPIKVKNFRVTTTEPDFGFDKILSENKLVTHNILFDVNQSIIKPESKNFMRELAQFLKTNSGVTLEIDGHTDNDGSDIANITLSKARADEVKKQLVLQGVAEARLTTKGFGATKPLQSNSTPTGKAENRRVELIKVSP
jgi:outer membrane protein OmpA-like peptidoglycan-associated protein